MVYVRALLGCGFWAPSLDSSGKVRELPRLDFAAAKVFFFVMTRPVRSNSANLNHLLAEIGSRLVALVYRDVRSQLPLTKRGRVPQLARRA